MTRRERLEEKAARRRDWAASREAKADAALATASEVAGRFELGQPILVGHHSERRARRDQERIHSSLAAASENTRAAAEHERKADGIDRQLRDAIYSDDPDAPERLTEKVATLTAELDRRKTLNAEYRREHRDELKALSAYGRSQAVPFPPWAITNLSATLRASKKRLEQVGRERTESDDRVATLADLHRRLGGTSEHQEHLDRGDLPDATVVHLRRLAADALRRDDQHAEYLAEIASEVLRALDAGRGQGVSLTSRYPGNCADCGDDIDRGEAIVWYRSTKEAVCADCFASDHEWIEATR